MSFALDFGGATPEKAIELALPAPAGAPAGRPILVLREMRAAGVHGWMLHELATQEGGRLVTLAPGAAPFSAELFAEAAGNMRGETSSGPSLGELAAAAPGAMLPGIAFAGNYTISWTPEPLGFLGFPTTFWNDAYVETALTGIVTVLNRAIESLLEHDAVLIPTLLGAPVAVTVHDAASGFVLYEGDFLPPPGDGGIAEIPPATFGDTTAPHPLAGAPLRLFVLDAAEAAGGELDLGVSFLFAGDSVAITGASGSVSGEARVRLLGLDDARSSFTTAATDGTFELQATVAAGNRYLLALGARIDATAALEIAWSEPLGDGLGAIRVLDDVGRVIGADVDFGADRSVVVVTPRGGWPTDRDLRLELGAAIADPSGNRWEKTLELDFRARASQVVGHYPFEHVYDVARLGELLFLAAGQQGLAVLDASDPSELENVMPGGLTFPLPYSDVVRAVAVDPHGRVLVAGGGVANFGVLRVFDPLALPEILAAPDPAAARGLAWRGTTIVSDRLGGTGTQLPSGTPRKLALYSDDLTSRWRVGEPAPDGLVATFTAGEAGALGTLAVSGNGAADGAPVSLRNLTRAGFARVDAEVSEGRAASRSRLRLRAAIASSCCAIARRSPISRRWVPGSRRSTSMPSITARTTLRRRRAAWSASTRASGTRASSSATSRFPTSRARSSVSICWSRRRRRRRSISRRWSASAGSPRSKARLRRWEISRSSPTPAPRSKARGRCARSRRQSTSRGTSTPTAMSTPTSASATTPS